MAYSSASEGEIVQDKAIRSRLPPTNDHAIDRRSRPRSPQSRDNQRPRNHHYNQQDSNNQSSHKRPYPRRHEYHQNDRYDRESQQSHSRYNQDPPEKRRRPNKSPEPARHAPNHQSPAPVIPEVPELPPVDEAKLIEERRKRREALRAKHRTQPQLLLQQALHIATGNDSDSVMASPAASLPSSPASPASPASFSITNDQDLANPVNADPDSPAAANAPSAADYDPIMDMQEDRINARLSAAAHHETKAQENNPDTTQAATSQPVQPKELDMFADDDNDDMFAPEPTTGLKKEDGTQAVRVPEAKQLDRSLLDDWDDPEGYYRIILGELLDDRYHVQTNLGKGVFSAVVRAIDNTTNRTVAIKIIRTQESM
jgi:serine/threonine-protein kinase PRP4